MLLRILHHTQYRYQAPVLQAHHLAYLRPRECASQKVLGHRLEIAPVPARGLDRPDSFGNWQTFFNLQSPHDRLDITADSLVSTLPSGPLPDSRSWESVSEAFLFHKQAHYDPATEFVFGSPAAPHSSAFADFARSTVSYTHLTLPTKRIV